MKKYDGSYEKPVIRAIKRRHARGPLPETTHWQSQKPTTENEWKTINPRWGTQESLRSIGRNEKNKHRQPAITRRWSLPSGYY